MDMGFGNHSKPAMWAVGGRKRELGGGGGSEGFLGIALSSSNTPTLITESFQEKIPRAKRSSTAGRQEGGVGELQSRELWEHIAQLHK